MSEMRGSHAGLIYSCPRDGIEMQACATEESAQQERTPELAQTLKYNTETDSTVPHISPEAEIDSTVPHISSEVEAEKQSPETTLASSERPQSTEALFQAVKSAKLDLGSIVDNRYRILANIGAGGMGTVYKVEHLVLNNIYALKTIHPDAFDKQALQRFKLEGKATNLLKHINIVALHDFGISSENIPYIVMEMLEGRSLAKRLAYDGPLTAKEFFKFFDQVCAGLSQAHKHGIIHRDLKPANIFICSKNELVKILDFGMAKTTSESSDLQASTITSPGEVVGSPLYMSPEQCLGEELDIRTDIYSLGAVMFESIAGYPIFPGTSALELMRKHCYQEAEMDESIPENLRELINKCVQKSRESRFQSVDELRDALSKLAWGQMTNKQNQPEKTGALYRLKRFFRS
jgi:serine/threonine protein kinase